MKKIISIALTVIMMMSLTVYAADSITVIQSNGNETTYYATKTIWNIDFDSTYSVAANGGAIKKDNANLALAEDLKEFSNDASNMSGETVTVSVGNAVNTSSIAAHEDVTDADHQYSLRLETTLDGIGYECQMNQMPILAKGGIAVVQNDFAIGKFPTGNNYIRVSHLQLNGGDLGSYNTGSVGSVVQVLAGGVIKAGSFTTDITVKENEWHTVAQVVNFDAKRINYYIDGEYVGYMTNDNLVNLWKMCFYHPKTGSDNLVSYFDNIKVIKASTDMVAIEASDPATTVAEGSPVALTTYNFNEEVVKDIKIYSSTDGVNYSEYSAEAEAVAYYKAYTTYYKAVGFDANGEQVSESAPVMLATSNIKANGTQYWDVDFEDGYSMLKGRVAYNDAYITTPAGNYFTTNAGSAGSAIRVESVAGISGNEADGVLVLDNTGATEPNTDDTNISAQINELSLQSTDNILVNEYDFAFNELPTKNFNIVGRFEGSYADTDTGGAFDKSATMYLSTAGKLYLSDLGASKGISASPNTWYHIRQVINLTTQTTDTYVNDEYMGTVAFTADKNWTKIRRFSATTYVSNQTVDGVRTYYANNNILYYDNFNIYSVAASTGSALEIAGINYYINGEAADKIAAGTLTADVTLSNNAAANENMQCIAAIYSAPGELDRVVITPVSFTADEIAKLVELNLGEVEATDSVKIFFWTLGENTLTPNGANATLTNE